MSRNDKYAISEAKNASFKVRFGTRAFLASETSDIFLLLSPSVHRESAAEQSLAQLTAMRVAQLIAGADSFAAAQFNRYISLFIESTPMKFACALLLSLICAAAHAQWTDKAGNRIPESDDQKSNGRFIAQLIFVTDDQAFFEKWATPSESVYIKSVSEVGINRPIRSFVIFGGCQPDQNRNCNVTMQFKVIQPDGKVYAETPPMEVWRGRAAPPEWGLEASVDYLKIIVEPDEQRGIYTVMVTVTDQTSGKTIVLKKQFSATDGERET